MNKKQTNFTWVPCLSQYRLHNLQEFLYFLCIYFSDLQLYADSGGEGKKRRSGLSGLAFQCRRQMLVYWPHYVSSCPEQVTLRPSVHLLRHISLAPDKGHSVKAFEYESSLTSFYLNGRHMVCSCTEPGSRFWFSNNARNVFSALKGTLESFTFFRKQHLITVSALCVD